MLEDLRRALGLSGASLNRPMPAQCYAQTINEPKELSRASGTLAVTNRWEWAARSFQQDAGGADCDTGQSKNSYFFHAYLLNGRHQQWLIVRLAV